MEKMNLSEKNLMNLKAIQDVMVVEEARAFTMNDALTRVLVHYHKFVPYNIR